MSIIRRLLYAGYGALKRTGIIRLLNGDAHYGNILVFHRVNDDHDGGMTTGTAVFTEMMKELHRNWKVVPLRSLVDCIELNRPIEQNTVAITFDDGYKDNILQAAPLLERHGFPATFFVTSGYIGTNRTFPWDQGDPREHELMTWDDVRELVRRGHEVGCHTINHVDLGRVSPEVARAEINGSKARIEEELGRSIAAFAIPYGKRESIRPEIVEIVRDAGFACCCSDYGGKVTEQSDPFNLRRIPIYPNVVEMNMELDNYMTYYDRNMHLHVFNKQQTLWHDDGTMDRKLCGQSPSLQKGA